MASSLAQASLAVLGQAHKRVVQVSELKERSTQNKALNDKKRLAQSYSHLASSR